MSDPTSSTSAPPSRAQSLRVLLRRAVVMEVLGYVSIYRYVFRRPRVPAGAEGFTYHQPNLLIIIVFIVVSAVELVAVDLIVHRWPAIRLPLLAIGVWGLVWMIGMLFGILTRPHAVGPEGIRARNTAETDVALSWDDIYSVKLSSRTDEPRSPLVTEDDTGTRTASLRVLRQTNVEIALEGPRELRFPQGEWTVDRVRLWVDDPKAFLAAVRRHL